MGTLKRIADINFHVPRERKLYPDRREELERIFLENLISPKSWGEAKTKFIENASGILNLNKDSRDFNYHKKNLRSVFDSAHRRARRQKWIKKIDSQWKLTAKGISHLSGEETPGGRAPIELLLQELRRVVDAGCSDSSRILIEETYEYAVHVLDNWPDNIPEPVELKNYGCNRVVRILGYDPIPIPGAPFGVEDMFRFITKLYHWLLRVEF